jgi:acyl-lipid omega-6 desaturase (Delta-12 desaturase)
LPIAPPNARDVTRVLVSYRAPSLARSIIELAITGGPLVLLWFLMWATLDLGYWLSLLLAVPAAGFLVRLFMIQHDCGHGAFFHRRGTNDWVGRAIGVLTLTPYDFWRRTHAAHHSTSGNLDRRGIGDIDTLTVDEYLARSRWDRLRYRVYRHPIIMFGVGPAYLFIIQHRLPVGLMRSGWRPWLSAMATNVAIASLVAAMIWLVGIGPFLLVQLPIILLAASAGVWLFYVQHQFENTAWARNGSWNLQDAALHGSSHYALPGLLR